MRVYGWKRFNLLTFEKMKVIYRKATEGDINDILQIFIEDFSQEPYKKVLDEEGVSAEIRDDIDNEDFFYVAEVDKKVI